MFVDQTSLLLALGLTAFGLSLTLFATWLATRSEGFILTWAVGAGVLVAAFASFSAYAYTSNYLVGWVSICLLVAGFVVLYAAACRFVDNSMPLPHVLSVGAVALIVVSTPFALGLDGLGAILGNLVNAILLCATARKFWTGRDEAPLWIIGIVVLYTLAGLSFLPCAFNIYVKNPLVLVAPPSGWAEDLNSIVGLVAIAGIGALSLALNQARVARRHHADARTDSLTGLLNRRALFDLYGEQNLVAGTAVIVFDLDRFKTINDTHGHAMGDEVLRRFALAVRNNVRPSDTAARLGGEEFALVMTHANPEIAVDTAERIRAAFEADIIPTGTGELRATVSAGVAFAADETHDFDEVVRKADNALYLAKRGGRNQVVAPGHRLVA